MSPSEKTKKTLGERLRNIAAYPVIVTMGVAATTLSACGDSTPKDPIDSPSPVASAPVTPGPSETLPPVDDGGSSTPEDPVVSPSETETTPTIEYDTVVTDSEFFKSLSAADQATVAEAMTMSSAQVERKYDERDRAVIGHTIFMANKDQIIEAQGTLILPGESTPLSQTNAPALGGVVDMAARNIEYVLQPISNITPDTVNIVNTQVDLKILAALQMASTGDHADKELANKIMIGTTTQVGEAANATHGDLAGKLELVDQAAAGGLDLASFYPEGRNVVSIDLNMMPVWVTLVTDRPDKFGNDTYAFNVITLDTSNGPAYAYTTREARN